jgi:hypothetical protein
LSLGHLIASFEVEQEHEYTGNAKPMREIVRKGGRRRRVTSTARETRVSRLFRGYVISLFAGVDGILNLPVSLIDERLRAPADFLHAIAGLRDVVVETIRDISAQLISRLRCEKQSGYRAYSKTD